MTISVTDPANIAASITAATTVQADTLTVTAVSDLAATPQFAFNGTVASFVSSNAGATAASFSATVNWGDGHSSSGTISAEPNGGFDVSASHTYAAAGNFTTSITVTDAASVSGSDSVSIAVQADSLAVSAIATGAIQNWAFTTTIASFSSSAQGALPSDFTASINWGDGQTGSGTVTADPSGIFQVTAGHTYTATGTFTAAVTITDPAGTTASNSAPVNVQADVLTTAAVNASASQDFVFNGTVARFTSSNAAAAPQNFTASINWGDGQSSSGTVSFNLQSGFTVSGK